MAFFGVADFPCFLGAVTFLDLLPFLNTDLKPAFSADFV